MISFTLLFSTPHSSLPTQIPAQYRRRFDCLCRRTGGGSRWDSNAESVRSGRFRFRDEEDRGRSSSSSRRWWSDEPADEFNDGFDPFDEDSEDIWDKIWIFKVFRGYGYMLPAIVGSLLLATGPKAFLMALAIPLAQSVVSLAIEKLWRRRASEGPRTGPTKTKRKPFSRSSYSSPRTEDDEEMESNYKGRNGYQSWVSSVDSGVDDRANFSTRSSFGGWDDLDNQKGRATGRSATQAETETVKQGKLSKKGRYRDAPLFLRLLIAVFPFLGSWTRML